MKRFTFVFAYILVVILFMVPMNQLVYNLYSSDNFGKISPITIELLHVCYPIIVGVLLAIPYLVRTLRQPGNLYYDRIRALAIGIPTFFVATAVLIYLLSSLPLLGFISSLLYPIYALNDIYSEVTAIASVILGYALVTSVKKSESKE